MGQNCARSGGSVVEDNRRGNSGGRRNPSRAYEVSASDDDDTKPREGGVNGTSHAMTQASSFQGCRVVNQIESLQHTMNPTVLMISRADLHQNFRQFTGIFPHRKGVLALASSEAAGMPAHLLAAGEDRSIALLNYETGHVMRRWVHAHAGDVNAVTPPLSSGHFATCGRDLLVKLWTISGEGRRAGEGGGGASAVFKGHTQNVTAVELMPDAAMLVSGSADGTVRLWDAERQAELSCRGGADGGNGGGGGDASQQQQPSAVSFVRHVPSIHCVVHGGEADTLSLWDVRANPGRQPALELARTIEGVAHAGATCCEVLSSHRLLTGHSGDGDSPDGGIHAWDLRNGKHTCAFTGHKARVTSLRAVAAAAAAESNVFLSASDDRSIGIWTAAHDEEEEEVDHTSNGIVDVERGGGSAVVKLPVSKQFHVPEGAVTALETMRSGDFVAALRSGSLVVFRPVLEEGDTTLVPTKRFRYVGVTEP